jgi:hypothetical protein
MIKRKQSVVTPKANTTINAHDILLLASDDKQELLAFAKGKKINLKKTQ